MREPVLWLFVGSANSTGAWHDVVANGIPAVGMPTFTGDVSEQDAELIRVYVARQAAMLYAAEQGASKTR